MRTESPDDAARKIRLFRQAILIEGHPWRYEEMISAYNWATAPNIARDDRTHRACRRFSRQVLRLLPHDVYHETESGRLAFGNALLVDSCR